jgi:Fe2+ or Zn2+ uptake regulation protein
MILETLRKSCNHPTAEDVYSLLKKDNPELSLGTVYRNLNVLCEQGEISKVESNFASERFDGNSARHYHLVCEKCGKLIDLPVGYFESVDETANASAGCRVYFHRIMFSGLCPECTATEKEVPPNG